MGLDAWSLDLSEDLRCWGNQGLRSILCEQDVSALKVSRETESSSAPVASSSAEPPRAPSPQKSAPTRSWKAPAKQPRAPHAVTTPAPTLKPSSSPVQVPSGDSSDLTVFPYEQFRSRLRVPSRTVWTYWELGQDFGDNPMDERRELFRKILHFLKWPTGSVTFWPHSFEHDKALIAQPGQFWKGVREAQASGVVVFGQQAFKTLFPRESFHYSSFDHNGRKITVLPGPVEMLAGDMDAKRLVWNTLKAYQF